MNNNEIMVLGDEAASWAAIDAGAKGVFAYPGTPSTEIFEGAEKIIEEMENKEGRIAKIGANEKVAYEFALGASYAGHRSMVTMKHVGLNVAMDAFVNSAVTGVNGGLIVAVADDPGMHSSQNEQDSRYLADFAHVPCLEPSTPQEVYDYTIAGYALSEKLKLPVVLRLVTRLAHSRGTIKRGEMRSPVAHGFPQGNEKKNWVLIPAVARTQNRSLRAKLPELLKASSVYNKMQINSGSKGVVLAGMGRAYFNQLKRYHPELAQYNIYEVGAYPVDKNELRKFLSANKEVHVFEENYPYLEDQLNDLSKDTKILGRRTGALTIDGELTPLSVKKALGMKINEPKGIPEMPVAIRPPRLCDGCGHIDAYKALREAQLNIGNNDYRMFGDIGCYTLGFLPPFEGIQACVEMGASIGMAMGAAYVGMKPAVGIIGDSTFFHSGLPTLMSLVKAKDCNVTLIVMDNRITGMTGQQETVITDVIEKIALAAGLPEANLHVLKPLPKYHAENVQTLEKVLKHNGPDVVVFKRECVQAMRKGLYKKIDEQK